MRLRFLDRKQELDRLRRALASREASLAVVYGRRRCGKSRLLLEALRGRRAVYYVGDEREGALQRRSLASAMGTLVPAFEQVEYPGWEALLERFWREAPTGAVLGLDEFPYLVSASPELPSLLQKRIDAVHSNHLHVVLCGSSQRMMQGLALDSTAPLYGRAREILRIPPLPPGWVGHAFSFKDDLKLLEAYSVWGGVPRYWELANEFRDTATAVSRLVLDPLGALYEEPDRLLLEDLWETAQASSVLSLIGEGCNKVSEIAGRLGKPATSLSRPLGRLVDLGLVEREIPFGAPERDSKRSRYVIADPFLSLWFRFASPRRSLIEARQSKALGRELQKYLPIQVGEVWERLARSSVPRIAIGGMRWRPAARWWGAGLDRKPIEIDITTESEDGTAILVGEAKLRLSPRDWARETAALQEKAMRFPAAQGRRVVLAIWCAAGGKASPGISAIDAKRVLAALR